MKNHLILLFISIFCIFCGEKNEDKTEKNHSSAIFCLKGNIDMRDYEDNFPPLTEEILTALTQWKVHAKNKLAIYLDSNQCVYVNRDLQGTDNLQTLFFKFIQNNDTLDFYSESPQKACVFVYSNAFGEDRKMKEQLNIIKETYDEVIENLRQVYSQRLYSKTLKDLGTDELEEVNQAYPHRIYIYPFEHREVYKRPVITLESLRDSLNDNTIIRILINSKYKILLEGEPTTLERLEDDIKQYVLDTTKKEVFIKTDNIKQEFIDKVMKIAQSSIDKTGRKMTVGFSKPFVTLENLHNESIIRLLINSKHKILLEGELTTLVRLEDDVKHYLSDTTKKEVTIRADHNVSQDFIDKIIKLVKNSIDKSGRVIEVNFAHFIKISE